MKIYTRRGDAGETGLFGGRRVSKDDARVEAYGTVDELNATLGVVVALLAEGRLRTRLTTIQNDLFSIGAHLATPPAEDRRPKPHLPDLPVDRTAEMEAWIDEADDSLEPLKQFVLPGGTPSAAQLHFARTVCRRAERRIVTLQRLDHVDSDIVPYVNRLSDLLFAWARVENTRGTGDVFWDQG